MGNRQCLKKPHNINMLAKISAFVVSGTESCAKSCVALNRQRAILLTAIKPNPFKSDWQESAHEYWFDSKKFIAVAEFVFYRKRIILWVISPRDGFYADWISAMTFS